MWKEFKPGFKPASFILLAVYAAVFFLFYFFFSFSKLPYWEQNLFFVATLIALQTTLLSTFSPAWVLLILFGAFSRELTGIPGKQNYIILNFFIEWGFFIWGFLAGKTLKSPSRKKFILYLSPFFLGIVLGIPQFLIYSKVLPVLLISLVFIDTGSGLKTNRGKNFFLYVILMLLPYFWLGFSYLIHLGIFLAAYLLGIFLFDFFLAKKVKKSLFIFFLSFASALFSQAVFTIPLYLIGLFGAQLMIDKSENVLKSQYWNHAQLLLFLLIFLKIQWEWRDLISGITLASCLIVIWAIVLKKWSIEVFQHTNIAFTLSFIFIAQPLGISNAILSASLFLVFFYAVFSLRARKKGSEFLLHLT